MIFTWKSFSPTREHWKARPNLHILLESCLFRFLAVQIQFFPRSEWFLSFYHGFLMKNWQINENSPSYPLLSVPNRVHFRFSRSKAWKVHRYSFHLQNTTIQSIFELKLTQWQFSGLFLEIVRVLLRWISNLQDLSVIPGILLNIYLLMNVIKSCSSSL